MVETSDVVRGDLEISTRWRRNLNLRVRRGGRTGYLIKQPDPLRSGGRRTLSAESRFYSFCADESRTAPLRPLLPRVPVRSFDPPFLAVEWLSGASGLWDAYRSLADPEAEAVAEDLGQGLGTLHSCFRRPGLGDDPRLNELPERPSGFLSLHRPRPRDLRRMSAANHRLVQLIQSDEAISEGLDRACSAWRTETVVHGDVRSGNVLVLPSGEAGPRVRLIDWELIKHGDAAWDVACAMAEHVRYWLKGMPLDREMDPERRAEAAEVPLARIRTLIGHFWRGYLGSVQLAEADATELMERAVLYSGGRLIQSAWENSSSDRRLSARALLLLQVSSNILAEPELALERLYGLSPAEAAGG